MVFASPGDLDFKPRQQWHTFWNADDGLCRILKIISPGGFERVSADAATDPDTMTGGTAQSLDAQYGLVSSEFIS